MFKRLLTVTVLAGLVAIAPASAQVVAWHTTSPALSAIDTAVNPPPERFKNQKAIKRHKFVKLRARTSKKKAGM